MKRRLTAAILTAVLLMSVLTTGVSAATGDDDSAVPAAQTESAAETVPAVILPTVRELFAKTPEFPVELYGDGHASELIAKTLHQTPVP